MNYANRELAEVLQPEPKPRLIPIRWADIHLMPKREALIERLLDRNAMSIVFGASGAGKTFSSLIFAPMFLWGGRGGDFESGKARCCISRSRAALVLRNG
jgi:hypothetical protein